MGQQHGNAIIFNGSATQTHTHTHTHADKAAEGALPGGLGAPKGPVPTGRRRSPTTPPGQEDPSPGGPETPQPESRRTPPWDRGVILFILFNSLPFIPQTVLSL